MNMHMWISAIWTFTTFFRSIEMFDIYGDICGGLCVCEEREGVFTASCENRGISSLAEVMPLHFTAYHLLLTGNLLKKVSLNDFVQYEGLSILHLGNNEISEFEGGAFNGLQGLKRLHLNNNKIEALKDDTFLGLDSLEYLQIDYNYISHVEPKAVSVLRHLEVLILNDNLLSALPLNLFQFVPLTHLDLRGNQLRVLPYGGLLEHLSRLVELQLEDNPWNCSCELIPLKAWLESISYTALVGDVVCETPFRLHGRDLDEISKQELCPLRAIAEYDVRAEPAHGGEILYRTTPATSAPGFASSTVLRATKTSRPPGKLRVKPTARSTSKPQNHGPMLAFQTKSPVPLDCPNACSCNLQISDLGLNVNCQERQIESISDLDPKPYNPKKMYLTGNYISADMFYGLQSLQFLYLEYNVIREIASGAFQQVPNLQLLFLNNNLLKTLPPGVFHGLNLARVNLRGNHLRSLPVAAVLEDLADLVQIDLFENPWDCSCAVVEMRSWLETLGAGVVLNSVACESPPRLSGEDMRFIRSYQLCPETSNVQSSVASPSEESVPGSTITLETLDYDVPNPAVPLSVLILALLMLFILSVFVAAGLFAVIVKRRKKSERLASANASAIYGDKARSSAGHVYEFIPPAAESLAKNTAEGNAMERYRDFEELRVLASNSDDEVRSRSEFSAGTPDTLNSQSLLDDNYFYREILARDQPGSYRGSLACKHQYSDQQYSSPERVQGQFLSPERVQQTVMFCPPPAAVYIEPSRSQYWELKAKLHFEPDYLEVHEKRTTFTQF
ncbi:SLIT and NTRK-like protein [Pimephales promelas]|nr:SLIT and NTRK-like protein [Pimephales promelas]KAG1927398.1 SLIT and NTRK-like protein [Pimephales promelas]KAG1927400.1 SLIT and NTRK-like protein [Pimephales promelas]KAG1927401.1 SLIT and NTRK-like protein [Pimephales promelas]